jgi:hypothetical protein
VTIGHFESFELWFRWKIFCSVSPHFGSLTTT